MTTRWAYEDLDGAELIWLLEIVHAGRVLRWSSRPCETVDADGEVRVYDGGLAVPEVEAAMQGPGSEPALPTVALQVWMPPDHDLAALVEEGHLLAGCTGELSLWAYGTTHEARHVYLTGRVEEPEYGAPTEAVGLSLSAVPWTQETSYPPPEAVISAETWPTAPDDNHGTPYPVIIGYPGEVGTVTHPGSIAYVVESGGTYADTVLIADGRVEASTVVLWYDGLSAGALPVVRTVDGLGRVVAVVDISAQATAVREADDYHVSWRQTTGGGMQGARGDELRGAGEVMLWALRTALRPVDEGAFAAVAATLDGVRIDASIEEPCDLYEWVVEHILPLLPAELISTGDGMAPALWRYDAGAGAAVAHLDVDGADGDPVTRVSPVTYSSTSHLANDVRVAYGYDVATDDYLYETRVDDEVTLLDGSQAGHPRISGSRGRFGRQTRTIETQVTCDQATAGVVAAWVTDLYSYPWREVTYEGGQTLGRLVPGDVVTVTDSDLAWGGKPALVRAVRWTQSMGVEVDLIVR